MPVIHTAIVGMRFYPGAARKVDALRSGEAIELRRERNNKHDPNAVAVHVREHKVGHIPASEVVPVAAAFDAGYGVIARIDDKPPYLCVEWDDEED
jgi:hypothetical protein